MKCFDAIAVLKNSYQMSLSYSITDKGLKVEYEILISCGANYIDGASPEAQTRNLDQNTVPLPFWLDISKPFKESVDFSSCELNMSFEEGQSANHSCIELIYTE